MAARNGTSDGLDLAKECTAEFVGTFILILFGNGAIAVATGAFDLWAVALMWFLGVALAICAVGAVSGAHVNPAVALGMAAFQGFPWRKVPAYVVARSSARSWPRQRCGPPSAG